VKPRRLWAFRQPLLGERAAAPALSAAGAGVPGVPIEQPAEFLHEHLAQASRDLLRVPMAGFINTLWSADADSRRVSHRY
jgi:hypothetical protein